MKDALHDRSEVAASEKEKGGRGNGLTCASPVHDRIDEKLINLPIPKVLHAGEAGTTDRGEFLSIGGLHTEIKFEILLQLL
jgi:hypothetical protein